MAITSLRACATSAAAILPSIVTILRDDVPLDIHFLPLPFLANRSQAEVRGSRPVIRLASNVDWHRETIEHTITHYRVQPSVETQERSARAFRRLRRETHVLQSTPPV